MLRQLPAGVREYEERYRKFIQVHKPQKKEIDFVIRTIGFHEKINSQMTLSFRCPSCKQIGSFEHIILETIKAQNLFYGSRRCPNRNCMAHVFMIWDSHGRVIESFPPERLDFDSSNIPQKIVSVLEEAISCYSIQAYIASAIMIRRTLEELCADKNVTGRNLKDRIHALGGTVILPPGLLEGMDSLRILGNDAAHIEAKDYENIGKEEVQLAIDVVKEVLKAVYQLEGLVNRLHALRKQTQRCE